MQYILEGERVQVIVQGKKFDDVPAEACASRLGKYGLMDLTKRSNQPLTWIHRHFERAGLGVSRNPASSELSRIENSASWQDSRQCLVYS